MNIDLTKIEVYRILDAIIAYKENYAVCANVNKSINNLEKKLKYKLKEEENK